MAIAKAGLPIVLGIIVAVLVGAFVGLVNGLLVTFAKLPPFIATLGMLGVAAGCRSSSAARTRCTACRQLPPVR